MNLHCVPNWNFQCNDLNLKVIFNILCMNQTTIIIYGNNSHVWSTKTKTIKIDININTAKTKNDTICFSFHHIRYSHVFVWMTNVSVKALRMYSLTLLCVLFCVLFYCCVFFFLSTSFLLSLYIHSYVLNCCSVVPDSPIASYTEQWLRQTNISFNARIQSKL